MSAKSPLRRATSSTAKPVLPDHTGKCTAVRISSSPTVVVHVPTKNSDAGTRRVPLVPADLELGVERQRDRRQLRRGVGVGDRPADGAAVADLEVTDERDRLGEQRHRLAGRRVVLDRALRRHRLDRERAVRTGDPAQVVDPVEVDDVLEAREPQRQHRHQALPAGQHLGLVAVLGEQRGDVGDRLRRVVLERCGLHRQLPEGDAREPRIAIC